MLRTKRKLVTGVLLALVAATGILIACRSSAGLDAEGSKAKAEEKTSANRERLRYGGKDFAYWREVWRDELKPEVRLEALTALRAFAVHGYADEATATVLEMLDELDPSFVDNRVVVDNAAEVWARIGRKIIPALGNEWECRQLTSRRFVTSTLRILASSTASQETAPLLLRLCKDRDKDIRLNAVLGLDLVLKDGVTRESAAFEDSTAIVTALAEILKNDEDEDVRGQAAASIGSVPDLVGAALKDKSSYVRQSAIRALNSRSEKVLLIPTMTQIMDTDKDEWVLGNANDFFKNLVPNDLSKAQRKELSPPLSRALQIARRSGTRTAIIRALERLGPDAKEAVPALRALIDGTTPENEASVREAAAKALKEIAPPPEPKRE